MSDGFAERLRIVVRRAGGVNALAALSGISSRTISKYLSNSADPSRSRLVALARAGGLSVEWLATGLNGSEARGVELGQHPGVDDFVWIDGLGGEASAGEDALAEVDGRGVNQLALPAAFLRSRYITAQCARLLTAQGDAMKPTICDGDTVMVDIRYDRLQSEGIYCLSITGGVRIRRLQRAVQGGIWIISDNGHYRDEYVAADDNDSPLEIVGRVVWLARSV